MSRLQWDTIGERVFETGLDNGVLFLPDGSAVPWNGLTSVDENSDKETEPVYFNGKKINDLVILGDFSATMKALTYPPEFEITQGTAITGAGVMFGEQPPKTFAFTYRNKVGTDLDIDAGYKIHIIYNVTAIPKNASRQTMTADVEPVEFEWNLVAVPQELPGLRPSAHITIDTRTTDPWLIDEIEEALYGGPGVDAGLIPMTELAVYLTQWARVKIVDNGDGTWTATEARPEFISFPDFDYIAELTDVEATYLDADTYVISDTYAPHGD